MYCSWKYLGINIVIMEILFFWTWLFNAQNGLQPSVCVLQIKNSNLKPKTDWKINHENGRMNLLSEENDSVHCSPVVNIEESEEPETDVCLMMEKNCTCHCERPVLINTS